MRRSEGTALNHMSDEGEEPGESTSDRARLSGGTRAIDPVVEAAASNGVEFQDLNSVYIDLEAVIDGGAWIGAGTHILGKSRIRHQARIGPNAIVENSHIGCGASVLPFSSVTDGSKIDDRALIKQRSEVRASAVGNSAEIGPNALVEDSDIAPNAKVGPFCRVRAGSEIGSDAYIGTQAEVKASRIGPGSKVGHFSFVGDAELGEDVNIGAGTVTANFDGMTVQKTKIADGASVGAGSVLIAPIRVGDHARTGAGSVVTKDVPDRELVLGVPARARLMAPTNHITKSKLI